MTRVKDAPLGFVTGGQLSPRIVNENRQHVADAVDDLASRRYTHFTLRFPFHRTLSSSYDETLGTDVVQYWFKPPLRCTIERATLKFYGSAAAATDTVDIDLRDASGVIEDAWLSVTPGTSDASASDFNGKRIELAQDTDYYFRMVSDASTWDSKHTFLEVEFRADRWNTTGTESVPSYDPTLLRAESDRNATDWNTEGTNITTAETALAGAEFLRCDLFVAHTVASGSTVGQYTWPLPAVDSDVVARSVGITRGAIAFSSTPSGNAGGSWIVKNAGGTTQDTTSLATSGTSTTAESLDQLVISDAADDPKTVADDWLVQFDHDTGTDTIDKAYVYLWYTDARAPTISYGNLTGTVSAAFSESPTKDGTITSYSLTAGTLPTGLSLNTSTGEISGTPTTQETQTGLQVTATGPGGSTASASFSITINAAAGFAGGNVSEASLQEVMELMIGTAAASPTAGGTLTINGQSVGSYDYTIFDTNKTVSSFTVGDWFTTTADSRAALVMVDGNLTVNSGQTVIPSVRKLLTCIYVNGDCAISGEISMSARGADHSSATGSNVTAVAIRLDTGATYSVPAAGGAGAAGSTSAGTAGTAGSSGGLGGGGSGGRVVSGLSGAGASGTSFSGGPGGGGASAATGNAGASDGGPGGSGAGGAGTGGGAGNPAGSGTGGSGTAGTDGTGGVLVIFVAGTFSGAGAVSADGSAGGAGNNGAGGGSGGGHASVLVLSGGTDSSSITPTAAGGAGGTGGVGGGAGGAGTAQLQTGV